MENETTLWLGSTESYTAYIRALAQSESVRALAYAEPDDIPDGSHPLLTVQGNVGVVSIAGTTIDGSAGWMVNYGIVGYDDIRNALVAAVRNPMVGAIMLNVASGGGHVAGVHESAKLIQRIDKSAKPVLAYTGSNMLSAAMWQAAGARSIYASETAEVGSIGILMVHRENSKQMAQEGITVTVVRAGENKALANSNEPLSKRGKELMEANAKAYYDIFLPWVANGRGVSTTVGESKFGGGATFVGKQAVEAGLVDKVGNYEDAITAAQKLASTRMKSPSQQKPLYGATNKAPSPVASGAKPALASHNSPTFQGNSMTTPLTAEALAALAQGVNFDTDEGKGMLAAAQALVALAEKTTPATPAVPAVPAVAATPAVAAPAVATPAAPDAMTTLGNMLASAQGQNGVLNEKVTSLTAQVSAHAETLKPFKAIACTSVKNMAVALKQPVPADTALAAMTEVQILAEHTRLADLWTKTFKAGGVSAAPGEAEIHKPKAEAIPLAFEFAAPIRTK